MIRGQTLKEVEKTTERVLKCFEGAATVTGCEIKTEVNHVLAELRNEPSLGVSVARCNLP
jgi:metal-dependent amidase/aminoacylase/carboxypeptidase family protein